MAYVSTKINPLLLPTSCQYLTLLYMPRDSKTLGIVIRTEKIRDKDKQLSILTPDDGIINVLLFGAQKSMKAVKVSLYSEGIFSLYQKRAGGLYSLKDADILTAHDFILDDLDKISVSSLFSELVIKSRCSDGNVYKLFAEAIDSLEFIEHRRVAVAFVLKYLGISGLLGDFEYCPSCGRMYRMDEVLGFSSYLSVAVCQDCDTMGKQLILPPNARAYISRILELPFQDSIKLGISDAQLSRVYRYVLRTLEHCFPSDLETLRSGLLV